MPTREVKIRLWEVVTAFVILTGVFTFSVWKVQHDSASIEQLQHTNCSLKQFLLTAERARVRASKSGIDRQHPALRAQDRSAARGYADLARRFQAVGSHCNEPVGH